MTVTRAAGISAALFTLSALSAATVHPTAALAEPAKPDWLIAVPIPLAGPHNIRGAEILEGVVRGIEKVNQAGGLTGRKLFLRTYDDLCSGAGGEAAALTVTADDPFDPDQAQPQASVVIGHPCASAAVSAASIYAKRKIPFFAPAVRHPALTEPAKPDTASPEAPTTTFRLTGNDAFEGRDGARWLHKTAKGGRVAIVHDRTGYAKRVVEAANAELTKLQGGQPGTGLQRANLEAKPELDILGIKAGRPAYPDVVAWLGERNVSAFFFVGFPTEAAIILANLQAANQAPVMLTSTTTATDEFREAAKGSEKRVRALSPHPTTALDVRAEAALEAWVHAVKKAKADQTPSPRDAPSEIAAQALDTVAGPIAFDGNGDLNSMPSFVASAPTPNGWRPVTP